jgi:hypothetical protein
MTSPHVCIVAYMWVYPVCSSNQVWQGARVSLIIYLHPCSESMALALRFGGFLPILPKSRFFSSCKIEREMFGFGKNLFGNIVPFVEVTLVSMFHEIWWTETRDQLLGDLSSCWEHVQFCFVSSVQYFSFSTFLSLVFSIFLHFQYSWSLCCSVLLVYVQYFSVQHFSIFGVPYFSSFSDFSIRVLNTIHFLLVYVQ